MSDSSDTEPQKPSVSTSTVPLKKETVRISLRAPSEDSGPVAPKGSTAPVSGVPSTGPIPPESDTGPTGPLPAHSAPTAPVSAPDKENTGSLLPKPPAPAPPAPSAPTPPPAAGGPPPPPAAPSAPAPPAPAATPAPPAPGGGAKTIPLAKAPDPLGPTTPVATAGGDQQTLDPLGPTRPVPTAGGSASPVGAKTIPLAKAPAPAGPGPVGKTTTPLQPGAAKPLPQATVKMGKTQPMGTPGAATSSLSQKPNIQSTAVEAEEEWEEEYEESGLMPFAIIVLVLALAVLAIELFTKMGAGG